MDARETRALKKSPPYYLTVGRLLRLLQTAGTFTRRYPVGAIGGLVLLVVTILATAAPLVAPYDPLFIDVLGFKQTPSWAHWLGTDYHGRDILSRIIFGGRVSLQVSFLSVLLGTTMGAMWGVASAYIGGRFDMISQRLLEVVMSFPALILAMILVSGLGAGLWTVIIAIAVTRLPYGVRVIRSVAMSIKENDYVLAARAIGVSNLRMMALHIAPQCVAAYLVLATAHLGVAIVIEASLGFLGAGVPPPTPTWGNMLGGAVAATLVPHWPLVVFPGLAITLTVLGFNLFGDALRDRLDPKLRGRGPA